MAVLLLPLPAPPALVPVAASLAKPNRKPEIKGHYYTVHAGQLPGAQDKGEKCGEKVYKNKWKIPSTGHVTLSRQIESQLCQEAVESVWGRWPANGSRSLAKVEARTSGGQGPPHLHTCPAWLSVLSVWLLSGMCPCGWVRAPHPCCRQLPLSLELPLQ